MRISHGMAALGLIAAVPAAADVRGPEGDRGFRYVYPVASVTATEKLYKADLKALTAEGNVLTATDGGTLSADHRTYLDTRRAVVERRHAEALGQPAGG
ncbi:MAG: hypothetical protein ACRYG4_18350 [Janthinobacterium lividum]